MEQKREEGKKRFKKKRGGGGEAGSRGGCLKEWGSWLTLLRDLTNYVPSQYPRSKEHLYKGDLSMY